MARAAFVILVTLPLLAACAQKGAFPSLKPRAPEQLATDEPVRIAPVFAPGPELNARIDALLAEARRGQAEFAGLLPSVRAAAQGAGGFGTESWVAAQQALSRLEAARRLTVNALADLDNLALERAARPTNAEQYRSLLAAVDAVEDLTNGQEAEIDRLRAALG